MRHPHGRSAVLMVTVAAALVTSGCGASPQVWAGPSQTVTAQPGSRHCGEDSVLFLVLGGQQYLYDPGATIPRQYLAQAPEKSVPLPADATDTGFRRGKASLWLAADGGAVYVVSGGSAELWPLVVEGFGCD